MLCLLGHKPYVFEINMHQFLVRRLKAAVFIQGNHSKLRKSRFSLMTISSAKHKPKFGSRIHGNKIYNSK